MPSWCLFSEEDYGADHVKRFEEDELLKLRDSKSTFHVTMNSLNNLLFKIAAKKKKKGWLAPSPNAIDEDLPRDLDELKWPRKDK